ncbi:hypothetical protein ACJJTC_001909, partial [Scirpophaga incertulas]
MDNKETPDKADNQESNEEKKLNLEVKCSTENRQSDDGPSGFISLPGEVEPIKLQFQSKTGLSKSEHSIRHIITSKDVANAIKSLNIKNCTNDIIQPIINKCENNEQKPTTLVDLNKFLTSCHRVVAEPQSGIQLNDISNHNVDLDTIPIVTNVTICEAPNSSSHQKPIECVSIHKVNKTNVNSNVVVEKSSKSSEKKKTSGNLSERSEYGIAQRDSLSSIGSNVCRICMTRGRERLISPCNCKGSLANVHLSCLERWLNQVGRNHCELCGYSYPAKRTPRYTILQALRLWFGNPRNRSHLQSDCLIFWLLSTVTAGLLAVCIVGTQYFVIQGNKFGKLDAGLRKQE